MTPWSKWIRGLAVFFGVGFIAAILFPIFGRPREPGKRYSCQSQLKQIGLGMIQYTQDYDEKFPLTSNGGGWANVLQPYVKSVQLFQCPSEKSAAQLKANPKLTGYTDYFYNARLQKRWLGNIGEVARLIASADGNDGQESTNASYAKTAIPDEWRTDSTSPAFRHLGYATYLFVDGHVKALSVERISTNWAADKYYFQPAKP